MVLSQDRRGRISEPDGSVQRIKIEDLKPMGDLVTYGKPSDIEKQFVF